MPDRFARLSVVIGFPSTISSDQAFDEWMRALDKLATDSGVTARYSTMLSVHSNESDVLNEPRANTFAINTRPTPPPLDSDSAVLVSETQGGIFAYFRHGTTANTFAKALNKNAPRSSDYEHPPYYILPYDDHDHAPAFQLALASGEIDQLYDGDTLIGFVMKRNPELKNLFNLNAT